MSRLTDFLKLFKYDPTQDGDSTFNLDTALNENWDRIDIDSKKKQDDIEKVKSSLEESTNKITNINDNLNNVMAQGKIKKVCLVETPPTIENALDNVLYLVYE